MTFAGLQPPPSLLLGAGLGIAIPHMVIGRMVENASLASSACFRKRST